jgi:hypothetical protein
VYVDHLQGGELFEDATRRQPRRQRMQAPAQGDVQAISQEGKEDVTLDPRLELVEDRPDREITPCYRRGRLLRA